MILYMLTTGAVWGLVFLSVAHIIKNVKHRMDSCTAIARTAIVFLSLLPVSGGAVASVLITRVQELHQVVII